MTSNRVYRESGREGGNPNVRRLYSRVRWFSVRVLTNVVGISIIGGLLDAQVVIDFLIRLYDTCYNTGHGGVSGRSPTSVR